MTATLTPTRDRLRQRSSDVLPRPLRRRPVTGAIQSAAASTRKARPVPPPASLDLTMLADLGLADLRARWHEAFGIKPLTRLSHEVLIAALSYHAQEQASGGLAKKTERRLEKLAAELGTTGTIRAVAEDTLRPGTRLLREWNGVVHEVIVLDKHFVWKEQPYASLSEIARAITGARWSGPRFFGTPTKPRGGAAGEEARR